MYSGYGIAPQEAQARLLEAEEILVKAWTTPDYTHHGTFWQLTFRSYDHRSISNRIPP